MKEVTKQFLEKAEEAIVAAQQLLGDGHAEFVGESIETSKVETMIQQAREFLQTAQQYIAS